MRSNRVKKTITPQTLPCVTGIHTGATLTHYLTARRLLTTGTDRSGPRKQRELLDLSEGSSRPLRTRGLNVTRRVTERRKHGVEYDTKVNLTGKRQGTTVLLWVGGLGRKERQV